MSLPRLGGSVRRLASSSALVVTRGSVGTTANGRYSPGPTSTLTIAGSVQPLNGKDLLRLPEGMRTRDLLAVFTETELRVVDAGAGTPPDVLTINGAAYEVEKVERWAELGGYWKAIVAKAAP